MFKIAIGMLLAQVSLGAVASQVEKAVFAGGCFWCMEAAYQELPGVKDVVSGFTGGELENPTYNGDHRGHYEAVEVTYDPNVLTYQDLLNVFWINIDPFDKRGQFCDKGFSYQSAVFVQDAREKALAEASKQAVADHFPDKEVVTAILERKVFYPVAEYHQDYYLKNPIRYRFYRAGCGRDRRLQQIWGDKRVWGDPARPGLPSSYAFITP